MDMTGIINVDVHLAWFDDHAGPAAKGHTEALVAEFKRIVDRIGIHDAEARRSDDMRREAEERVRELEDDVAEMYTQDQVDDLVATALDDLREKIHSFARLGFEAGVDPCEARLLFRGGEPDSGAEEAVRAAWLCYMASTPHIATRASVRSDVRRDDVALEGFV